MGEKVVDLGDYGGEVLAVSSNPLVKDLAVVACYEGAACYDRAHVEVAEAGVELASYIDPLTEGVFVGG